ncbi:adenylosuccinate synthase [Thermostilla marina]
MSATCVVGLQWGDEAKGKLVDLLTEGHDIVVRYQGGANAGHTVVVGGETYKLSLIPSGIFNPNVRCVIAGGVVINPKTLLAEIDGLVDRGIHVAANLMISDRAHVIFPWHMEEDRILNACTGGEAIGTTMRGIGPCYRDKVGRSLAVRVGDLYAPDFKERIQRIVEVKNRMLACLVDEGEVVKLDPIAVYDEYSRYAERLEPMVADTTAYLLDAVDANRKILFEGAQGSLLDIDHGTFPYVTSSNSSAVGVAAGSGVPFRYIDRVIGVAKAYTTRVGGGPFPTELDNEIGQRIRDQGNEYGTVTRRPRRCGWLDIVALRYTARLGGIDRLAIMLLDVLSGLNELAICTAYRIGGETVTHFPSQDRLLREAEPVLETMPGWQEDITSARRLEDLPVAARNYLDRIAELVGRPIGLVSVGPDREQTIVVDL